MVKIEIVYEGQLHCSLKHGPSDAVITTDAPKDNHGKGEAFSPTDMVAGALGACMLTLMGITAQRHKISLDGTRVQVSKEMVEEPARKIGKLTVIFQIPSEVPPSKRERLERAALTCPVQQSLHTKIEIPVTFEWGEAR